ncbi:MAG: hypothetical protein U5K77_02950 [Candidatus Saccharibacteria bacterium]|nr:hypothetical protein [Candidatus Saccharibacteria bacterium]
MSAENLQPEQHELDHGSDLYLGNPSDSNPDRSPIPQAPTETPSNPGIGHVIRIHSNKEPGRVAPGAKLSPEASRKLQEELADIRRAQWIGSATGNHTLINTRNHRSR